MVQAQRKWCCSAQPVLLCGCGNDTRSPGHCGDRLVTWLFLHFRRSEGAPAIYMLLEIKPEKPEIFMYKWHIEHLKNICLFLQIISRPISMWCTTYVCDNFCHRNFVFPCSVWFSQASTLLVGWCSCFTQTYFKTLALLKYLQNHYVMKLWSTSSLIYHHPLTVHELSLFCKQHLFF